jgi:hypothetical protein
MMLKNSRFYAKFALAILKNTLLYSKMKILLDIPDNKATSFMDIMNSISYVKAKPLTDSKAKLMSEIKEAVEEMKLIRAGKKKARNAEDFLNDCKF